VVGLQQLGVLVQRSASVSVTYSPQHAFNSFTSYQAGSWSNGSYSFSSVTYDGTGNLNWSMTSRETWGASGGGNINDSSSGISTSGVQVNSNYTFTSNYSFNGNGSRTGSYTLHEEGNFGNGTYGLGCMAYAVSGSGTNGDSYGGTDSVTGTTAGLNYSSNDNYSGSANGNSNYSLSEFGQYAAGVWTISQFTESETTVTSGNYSDTGSFSSVYGSGTDSYSSSYSSNFNLYGVGDYANGSFSFQTFSASLVAGLQKCLKPLQIVLARKHPIDQGAKRSD
jgi:hypothetical protein